MRTNFVKSTNLTLRKSLNHIALRAVLMVLLVTCGVGEMWADPTYYYAKLTVQCKTGDGYVYASKENTSDVQYGTGNSTDKTQTSTQNEAQTFFAWAMPDRGAEFAGWEKTSNINSLSGSSNPYTVTVKASSTDVTEGKLTATWTKYTKVNVTYNASEDGEYKVNYSYNSYDGITKTITAGDAEGLSCTINSENGNKTIGSYYNDVITLTSEKGTFQGWYSDAGFTNKLSDANPYTYVAPQSGTGSVYAKYPHVDKYYGRLKASIAEEPYSMPGGGMIFISKESAAAVEYSDEEQTVDNVGMGTTDLIYYLKAQPTDKRYVFRGWYSNPECTGTALSTNADYTYTFTATSMNSADPTLGNVYAAFDFNLYYMQVEVEPAIPSQGMVLASDTKLTTLPDYTGYSSESSVFTYAYRGTPTKDVYVYAKPKYGYKLAGWYTDAACTSAASVASDGKYTATGFSISPLDPTIIKLYAKFVEEDKINVTYNNPDHTKGEYKAYALDIAEINDEYVWSQVEIFSSIGKSANTVQSQYKTDMLMLEAEPLAGYGVTKWYDGADKTSVSHLYNTTATTAKTVGVTFGDAKPFKVGDNYYVTLSEALTAVGSSGQITVVQNAYVAAGNYTIPKNVTLLVPFNDSYTCYKEMTGASGTYASSFSTPSVYVTLTLGNGANIILNGEMSVSATMCWAMGSNGSPSGKYGLVRMNSGSTITLKNGSKLYAWGYITGEGAITAESGSHTYEGFQVTGYRGGNATSGMAGNSEKVFPMNQYYIQNIENKITFQAGALEHLYMGVTSSWGDEGASMDFIGGPSSTNTLFLLKSGATLTKWYDPSKDRQKYELNGDATLDQIVLDVASVSSKDYVLPLTNNMDLDIVSGTTTINYDVAIFPDVNINIRQGAKITIKKNVYVYDTDEWNPAYAYAEFTNNDKNTQGAVTFKNVVRPIKYTTMTKYSRTSIADARIVVDGTLNIASGGKLYTTSSGANICSENSGVVQIGEACSANSVTYQAVQSTTGKANTIHHYDAITVNPARLHNGDDSYTQTAGAVANDQFIYSKSQEKWLKNPKVVSWNANGGTTEASTLAYSEGSFVGELPAAYKDGYTLGGWYTDADGGSKIDATTKVTANITYYAHWSPKSYTITYRDNGGVAFSGTHIDTPTPHPTTHTFGTATTLNGATRPHYTFGGWYKTVSCTGTVVTSLPASTCKNITLYAKWTINTHKLTWNWDGGSTSSTTYTAAGDAVAYNTAIVYPEASTMTKANFVFNGWDKSITTMPDEDLTITARWIPAEASVTVGGNTTYHATVADAITAANGKTNAVVTILQNASVTAQVNVTAAMTIDLNGKTVSSTLASATGVFNINASGKTVTIRDSQTGGKIDHTASYAGGYMYGINLTAGTLNIESGTIYAKNTANNRAYGIYNAGTTTLNISGGTIEATSTTSPFGIYDYSNCTLTMTGGSFTASGPSARGVYTKGTTTLTNATITASGSSSYAIFAKAGTMIINSGTYTATGTSSYAVYYEAGTVTVNGGEFSGAAGELKPKTSYGTNVKLQGGYYVHETDLETNCAAKYHVLPLTGEDPYKYEVAEAYTITFMNGEDELQSDFVKKDETPSYSGTPEKTASAQYTYTFDGWSTTDGGDKLASLPAVSADATYFAHYATTLQSYDVTFNLKGHGDAITSQTKDYGSKVDKPTDPTADGWIFGGWFKEASCTNEWNFSTDYVQGTTELFAKWTMDGVGPKLDIVDWTSSTLTINMNGIPAAGWPYTIKVGDLESYTYAKDDRAADRTLTILYSGSADTKLTITVKDKDNNTYSRYKYIIPHVYGETAELAETNSPARVIVVNSGTLTVKGDVAVNAIYVGPEAELVVNSGVKLTVNSLMLRTTPWKAASLDNNGTIVVSDQAYYTRIIADNSKYFQFAIPLLCDVKNVRLSNNSKCTYNTSWMLKSYNEESRANNGAVNTETISNWDLLTTDGEGHATILGSVGYEMFSNTPYYREYYFPVELPKTEATEVGVSYHSGEAGPNHAGWNALCSPLMGKYSQTSRDPSERLKISQLNPDGTYQQTAPDIINPAVPFYYQASDNGKIYFNGDAMIFNAPRRAWNAYVPTQWLQLAIRNLKGDKLDETSIYAHPEKFAPEYETGYDVAKQSLTGGKALIYSELPCGKLAFAAVPDSLAEQRIPLSIYAATQEEYVFSLAENNYLGRLQHVLLHDTQNGLVIDLLERDYATEINAGTKAGRFYIQCVFAAEAPAVTTGVNSVESNDDAPQKIMYKNKVYIIYQGRVYDMTGRQCELK